MVMKKNMLSYAKSKQDMFIFSIFNLDSFSVSLGAAFASPNCLILAVSYKCIIVTKQLLLYCFFSKLVLCIIVLHFKTLEQPVEAVF